MLDAGQLKKLKKYIVENDFIGYDPFDGLSSSLFNLPFLRDNRALKILWIQINKLCPINLRSLFLVPKGFNVKAGALFLMGYINLLPISGVDEIGGNVRNLLSRILSSQVKTDHGLGFGYNFDWEARAFSAPKGTPNAIVSSFVGRALISYARKFEANVENELEGIKEFFLLDMKGHEDKDNLWFYYIPDKNIVVHNANLMSALFLSQYYNYKGSTDREVKIAVQKAVNFSTGDIGQDFSWPYGTSSFHRWVDNFHTAFNLEALMGIDDVFPEFGLIEVINKVLGYYLENLFTLDGTPKYYNNNIYPVDIHSVAQTKILFTQLFKKRELFDFDRKRAEIIKNKNDKWIEKFQSKEGYFYYRKTRFFWNRIPYMRWGQAWMFYALSTGL